MVSKDLGLPVEFVAAVATQAQPDTAIASFAADQAHVLPAGPDRERLLAALLSAAFRSVAPAWLLEAAIDQGLSHEENRSASSGIDLLAAALAHPDCGTDLRESALRECTDGQLAGLGTARRPGQLTAAVAAELRRRSPNPAPMTRDLLTQPTPALVALQTPQLADAVFKAALDLLPTHPKPTPRDDADKDGEDFYKQFKAQVGAWNTMWTAVLEVHVDRHALLVECTEGGPANHTIRDLLLGTIPWMVEPLLLKSLAQADLDHFNGAVVATHLCRAIRDGASKHIARERFASQIDALSPSGRQYVEIYLEEDGLDPEWGCNTATNWPSRAASGNWRLILNPAQAKPRYSGDPYTWRASQADLEELGRTFAETTVSALTLWEPGHDGAALHADLLRWIAELLTHLPHVSGEVKAAVRPIATSARTMLRPGTYSGLRYEERASLEELVAMVEKIIADPAPGTAARRRALGDPALVTVRTLSEVPPEALADYLDRYSGDDALVEKALFAIVLTSYGPKSDFGDILSRHSGPDTAIRAMTHDLRRRLGGNPAAREQWAHEVLALPNRDTHLIRALPAWTALKLSGARYGRAYPEIIDVVTDALGEDANAWRRLAHSPITYTGPTAWLRLGDILDAARTGSDWPAPPPR